VCCCVQEGLGGGFCEGEVGDGGLGDAGWEVHGWNAEREMKVARMEMEVVGGGCWWVGGGVR
jgi:hypothetical protein